VPAQPAIQRLPAAYASLTKKLGRPPTTTELAEALGVTPERARVLCERESITCTDGRLTPLRRCNLGQPPVKELGPVGLLAYRNLQRVYADVIARPNAPSDADLGTRAGYKGRPDKNAVEFRRFIEGKSQPSIEQLGRLATALGVHVSELLRPLE
jgi:transcriptional regulator with XRE-family HTH domain